MRRTGNSINPEMFTKSLVNVDQRVARLERMFPIRDKSENNNNGGGINCNCEELKEDITKIINIIGDVNVFNDSSISTIFQALYAIYNKSVDVSIDDEDLTNHITAIYNTLTTIDEDEDKFTILEYIMNIYNSVNGLSTCDCDTSGIQKIIYAIQGYDGTAGNGDPEGIGIKNNHIKFIYDLINYNLTDVDNGVFINTKNKVNNIYDLLIGKNKTFTEIFASTLPCIDYDINYVPPPETDATELTGNPPYYIIDDDNICVFYNVSIDSTNANYAERLNVLKLICKRYSKYTFNNCSFTNTDLSYLFAGNTHLVSFPIFVVDENDNPMCSIKGILNFSHMFDGCSNLSCYINNDTTRYTITTFLTELLGACDTTSSTEYIFDYMFANCPQMATIDYPIQLNTENGTEMVSLFAENTTYISMEGMFSSIHEIRVESADAINMNNMFKSLTSLKSINVKNMFASLYSVIVDPPIGETLSNTTPRDVIPDEETGKPTNQQPTSNINMNSMFKGCVSLNSVCLSDMFPSLTCLINKDYKGHNIDMSYMFNGCSSIKNINMFSFMKNLTMMNTTYENLPLKQDNILLSTLTPGIHQYNIPENLTLKFAYSDFVFSNALGNEYNNKPFGTNEEGSIAFSIVKSIGDYTHDDIHEVRGFPIYKPLYAATDGGETKIPDNHYKYYDGKAQKIITWVLNILDENSVIYYDTYNGIYTINTNYCEIDQITEIL